MDSEEKFEETKLPPREQCASNDDYAHAQKVWNKLNMQNLHHIMTRILL